ncbi:MAG: hypothetical protein LBR07_09465, partial [Puniceicoccales bacterium]|nr:hypothetical protein [Puniceicoccales bacterium]
MSSPLSFFRAFATAGAFVITVTAAAGAAPETAGTNAALDALPLVVAERFDTPDALAKWTRLQGTANVAGGVATLRGV